MSTTIALMTAEEFAKLGDTGRPTELVRGRVVELNVPSFRHGTVCATTARILGVYVYDNDLGRVVSNDGGVITEHDPDTVRGPDVTYISYQKVPKGPTPATYIDIPPELVVEVLSPSDRWSKVLAKVAEYLDLGVPVVCLLDPELETAQMFRPDEATSHTFAADDELTFPEILPGFSVRVGKLFE